MKKIIYTFNGGTEEKPFLIKKEIECATQEQYDANYRTAKEEAIGEIIVEGDFEPDAPNSLDARVETLETDNAEIKEALDMILNGVTE